MSGVVNELLGWRPKERSPSLAPGPFVLGRERVAVGGGQKNIHHPWPLALSTLSVRGRERVAGVAAKRTFTSPGPWPLSSDKRRLVPRVAENELLGPARWQQPNAGRFLRSQLDVRLSKLFDPRSRRVRYLRQLRS